MQHIKNVPAFEVLIVVLLCSAVVVDRTEGRSQSTRGFRAASEQLSDDEGRQGETESRGGVEQESVGVFLFVLAYYVGLSIIVVYRV